MVQFHPTPPPPTTAGKSTALEKTVLEYATAGGTIFLKKLVKKRITGLSNSHHAESTIFFPTTLIQIRQC
jgi:hypothetical protein